VLVLVRLLAFQISGRLKQAFTQNWRKKYKIADPEKLMSIDYFKINPKPYFKRAANLFAEEYMPTFAHYFISYLDKKGLLLRCFTQNIDTLERRGGLTGEKVVEAHGSVHSNHCIKCKAEYSPAWFKAIVMKKKIGYCEKCEGGLVKPDVVFFGEELPDRFFDLMDEDFPKCDLLLVMGSSLKVQPFSGLINKVQKHVPRVLINMEKAGSTVAKIGDFFRQEKGFDFDSQDNVRDVALLGDLQQTLKELVSAVGWEKELAEHQAEIMRGLEAKPKEKKEKKDKK
jgi:NAD-dependent deacetylase sirtuin 2